MATQPVRPRPGRERETAFEDGLHRGQDRLRDALERQQVGARARGERLGDLRPLGHGGSPHEGCAARDLRGRYGTGGSALARRVPRVSTSITMASGLVRAAVSTAWTASVVTSTSRSRASRSRWYCKLRNLFRPVAEQHARGHLCWGYRPTGEAVEGGRPYARAGVRISGRCRCGWIRHRDGLGAVVGAELLEDALEVRLDRVRGDAQGRSPPAGSSPRPRPSAGSRVRAWREGGGPWLVAAGRFAPLR